AQRASRTARDLDAIDAANQLELARARLVFSTQRRELDASRPGANDGLEHQIEALQEAVPELRSTAAAGPVAAAQQNGPTAGTWAMIQRLLALQRSRGRLEELETATNDLVRGVNGDLTVARAAIRPIFTRL